MTKEDTLSTAALVTIGSGLGTLGVIPFDSYVNGPLTRYDKRIQLGELADYTEEHIAEVDPADQADTLAYTAELRDSGPKEWFPYDVGFELAGAALTATLFLGAVRTVLRSRRESISR